MTVLERPLAEVATDIVADWTSLNSEPAAAHVHAMLSLHFLDDWYGRETAQEVVVRFLSTADSWHGPVAERLKAELVEMVRRHRGRWLDRREGSVRTIEG